MKAETIFTLEPQDTANVQTLWVALNMLGMLHSDDTPEAARKSFARIRGNQFSWKDVETVVQAIREERERTRRDDYSPLFRDPEKQAEFLRHIRETADRAIEQAEQFVADLRSDHEALQE